jgi:hypothetical protein
MKIQFIIERTKYKMQRDKIDRKTTRKSEVISFLTNDWDRFDLLRGNRELNKAHINKLMTSFQRFNNLYRIVKTTERQPNGKYIVLDGQHTLAACEQLEEAFPGEYPVTQIIESAQGIDEVITLNSNSQRWGRHQYIASYVSRNFPHYITIMKLRDEFPDIGQLYTYCCLLNPYALQESGKAAKIIQDGTWEVADYGWALERAQWMTEIKELVEQKDKMIFKQFKFQWAIVKMFTHPCYDHERFMARLKNNYSKIYRSAERKAFLSMFSDIFNYRPTPQMRPVYFDRLDGYK